MTPWKRDSNGVLDGNGNRVCRTSYARGTGTSQRIDYDQRETNERLIVAAPTLLALVLEAKRLGLEHAEDCPAHDTNTFEGCDCDGYIWEDKMNDVLAKLGMK
jgi:hypothetical protein